MSVSLPSSPDPSRRLAADPATLSDVYIDESSQTKHRFLILGGVIVPTCRVSEFEEAIRAARRPDLPAGEMAWTKVSKSKLVAYKRVVDVFFDGFQCTPPIEFHSLFVNTTNIRDHIFNQGSRDIGFNKEIYQIVIKFARLHSTRLLHIYLDERETTNSTEQLRLILNRGLKKGGDRRDWPFRRVHFRDSKQSQCIQLVDVLIGAVGYHINGHRLATDASPAKSELSDYILNARAKIRVAAHGTSRAGKFTIWERRLR
jgi:hypothetical protein